MVARNDPLNDVTHSDSVTWSRGGLSLGYQELVDMELSVGVAVLVSVRSKGASLLNDTRVLSCQLSLIPLIPTRSNHDDHLLTGGRLFGVGHLHRF